MEEELKNKLNKQVEEQIKQITEEGIHEGNVALLGKLVDIHKDLCNEKYWKMKEEGMKMYYPDYGRDMYGRRGRDSRGRYNERGGRGRGGYRGEDMLDEMYENYGTYMEGRNYGGPETDASFDYMLKSMEEFMEHLMQEAENPQQMEKLKRTLKRMSEMR